MKKRILLISVSLLLIMELVLGACTKATPTTATTTAKPTASQPATTTTTTTTTPINKYGGILKLINKTAAMKFGYPLTIKGEDGPLSVPMLEHLIFFNEKGEYIPQLATSWKIEPNGLLYTFILRKGVKFHDGTDFNAQAVKYNFDKVIKDPASTMSNLKSVDIVDDYTVQFKLGQPDCTTLYELASTAYTTIISPTALEKNGQAWAETNPVGTGPFIFKEFKKDTSMSMVRNPNYWQTNLPYLDGIEYIFIKDAMTQNVSFKAKEAQVLDNPDTTIAQQLIAEKVLYQGGAMNMTFIYGDSKNPDSVFAKKNVRLALEYAIDKEEICTTIGGGMFEPSYQVAGNKHPMYNKSLPLRKFDPAKASQLLKEAGYEKGFNITAYIHNAQWRDGWTAIQSYLGKVGINLEIQWLSAAAYDEIRLGTALKPNSLTHGQIGQAPSLVLNIRDRLATYSTWHKDHSRPAGIDALIAETVATTTPEKERELTQQLIKMVYDDETVVPVWMNTRMAFYYESVQDPSFAVAGFPNLRTFTNTWLRK